MYPSNRTPQTPARTEPADAPLLLSVPEAARLLNIGTTFAWELVHRGALPSIKLGRRVLIPRSKLEQLIASDQADQHRQ